MVGYKGVSEEENAQSSTCRTSTMYRLAILSLLFAVASAGIIGAPLAHGGLAIGHAAPLAIAPLAIAHAAPAATSYSNQVRVVHGSVPVVRSVAVAAPVAIGHAAPAYAFGHGGLALGHGGLALGHGYLH